ncbi:MAG: serine/threonine-protein kinase [Candidatus Krumholzibacteriia bacterium]
MGADASPGSSPFEPTLVNPNQNCLPERYQILAILGSGGMGRVLHAHDRVLDREVAVKFLIERYARDEAFAQRFLNEARSAASLNHPGIVQIYEFGHTETCAYLVMEYVDGRTLRDLMNEFGRYSERRACELVDQACDALGAAHDRGIVHRDVKPDNMMLTRAGAFKLVDLGLAKNVEGEGSQTETGQSVGTPHYISPEQVLGAKIIDQRADIYSLGASLYCMATGKVPFEGSSSAHIMSRHLNDPLPDPRLLVPDLSDGFCRLVSRAMAKDPAHRYQTMAEMRTALAQVRAQARTAPDHVATGAAAALRGPSETGARSALNALLEPADIEAIEANLTRTIGPVARLLMDRESRSVGSRHELLQALVQHIPGERERRRFLRECGVSVAGGTSEVGSVSGARPVAASLDPEVLAAVTGHLAECIGPVARVLVKRAAAAGGGLDHVTRRLAEQIPDAAARQTFLAAMARLG